MKCFVNFSSIRPGIDLRSLKPFLATSSITCILQLAAALFSPFSATAHPEKTLRTSPGGTADSLCQLVAVNDYAPLVVLADPAASQASMSFAQLLANDTLSDLPDVTISLVPDCGTGTAEPSPAIKVQLNPAGDGFIITGFLPGSWSFCYALKGCQGQTYSQAEVKVVVRTDYVPVSCDPEGCELVCFGDFEDFSNLYPPFIYPTTYPNGVEYFSDLNLPVFDFNTTYDYNTPDIVEEAGNGNQVLMFLGGSYQINEQIVQTEEGIVVPLSEPIPVGCSVEIRFDAAHLSANAPGETSVMQIFGLPAYDCYAFNNVVTDCQAGPQLLCQSLWANCMTTNDFPMGVPINYVPGGTISPAGQFVGLNLEPAGPLIWQNNTGVPISHLLMLASIVDASGNPATGSYNAILDNLTAELHCAPQLEVTSETPEEGCIGGSFTVKYKVCSGENLPDSISTLVTPELDLPSGWEITDGSLAPFVLAEGQCTTLTLQIQVPPDASAGSYDLALNGTADGICVAEPFSVTDQIIINDCGPQLSCPCTTANSLNLDAGAGTNVSDIPALNNLSNNVLDLTQYGNCLAINGRLIVNQHLTIKGDGSSQVFMQPCAEITINLGIRLTMELLNVQGCERMWRGITVEPHGRLVLNLNSIADAEFAVRSVPSDPFGIVKPTSIRITGNRFQRNHVGILIEPGPVAGELAHLILGNAFSNGSSGLLFPSCAALDNYSNQYGYAGVVALNPRLVVSSTNNFSSLRNGVIAEDCRLEVENSSFNQLLGNTPPSPSYTAGSTGVGILANRGQMKVTGCYFDKVFHAMYATDNPVEARNNNITAQIGLESHNAWNLLFQDNNPVNFVQYGVKARDLTPVVDGGFSGSYLVENNHFFSDGNNPLLVDRWAIEVTNADLVTPPTGRIRDNFMDIANQAGGIQLSNTNGWTLAYNRVRFLLNPFGVIIDATGVDLENSAYNYLYDNSVGDVNYLEGVLGASVGFATDMSLYNTWCCNISDGPATGFDFLGLCTGSDFRHSDISLALNSLHCFNATRISVQVDKGNLFQVGSGTATHEGGLADIAESKFLVYDANDNDQVDDIPYSPEIIATPNWFETSEVDAGDCPDDDLCIPPPHYPDPRGRELEPNDLNIAQKLFGNTPREQMLYWEGSRNLYARMLEYPELHGQDIDLDAFFVTAATGAIDRYHAADLAVLELNDLSATLRDQLADLYTTLSDNDARVAAKLAELAQAFTWTDTLAIYAQADSIRLLANGSVQELLDAMEEARQQRIQKAGAALTLVNDLPTTGVLESNRKTAYQIYLDAIVQKTGTLSPVNFATVAAIAEQCPLEGGTGVYLARALYQYNERRHFNDAVLCGAQGRSRFASIGGEHLLTLTPNPTTDVVNLRFEASTSEPEAADIAIFSLTGQQVFFRSALAEGGLMQLDVSTLPAGLYFCGITRADGSTQSAKLLIEH